MVSFCGCDAGIFILIVWSILSVRCDICYDRYTEIIVADNGTDIPNCLPCFSLQYVLSQIDDCTKISVYFDQVLNTSLSVHEKNGIVIQGVGDSHVTITWKTMKNTVLEFIDSTDIKLYNLHWKNDKSNTLIINFLHCTNIGVCNNTFTVPHTALEFKDSQGMITVSNCVFNQKNDDITSTLTRAYLYITMTDKAASNSKYIINECLFEGNVVTDRSLTAFSFNNISYLSSSVFNKSLGGGLHIEVTNIVNNVTMTINNTMFLNNGAWIGGGAYISIHSDSWGNKLKIHNCTFEGNSAGTLAGGLYVGVTNTDGNISIPDQLHFDINICDSYFFNNMAVHAGAMAYECPGQVSMTHAANTDMTNAVFEKNLALDSGAATGFFKWENGLRGETPVMTMTNCSIIRNTIYHPYSDEIIVLGSGVLYSQGIPIVFAGYTDISFNYGTAILASSASIYMTDHVMMKENYGVRGGAFNLISGSRIVVEKGLNITFQQNYAELYGGVVFHTFPVLGVVGENEYCAVQYGNATITNPQDWEVNLWFIDNDALQAGKSFYLSSPDSCFLNEKGKIFAENKTFHFLPTYARQIMTPPVQIQFSSPSPSYKCTDSKCWFGVMLGEVITVTVIAVDYFNQPVKSFAVIDIACLSSDGLTMSKSPCNYSLGGDNLVELTGNLTRTPFYIIGNYSVESNNDIVLIWRVIEQPTAVAYLHVHIKSCYLGYVYDLDKQICMCYNGTEDEIVCNQTDYTACIKLGYWYGAIYDDVDDSNHSLWNDYGATPCPFGFCNFTINGGCPTRSCGSDRSAYRFYCVLPQYGSDDLCLFDRGGILCSGCRTNYSFSFDAISCLPDDKCSNNYLTLTFFLNFLFWALIISIILIVAKVNLRIGSGQLYCLVFYFSVLQYFVRGTFPSYFLYVIELTFTGFIQLDPKMFGLIKICNNLNIDNLTLTAIHYTNPLFLILVIAVIACVSHKCPKYAIFQNTNIGVNLICIVLYIVFISLTQTSLSVLTPVSFPGVDGIYVSLKPSVRYFDPKGHLPYALVAFLIQVFLVIPFLSLLLFAPCLIKTKRVNLIRLKPILDEFQACYKDKYRCFAGYYLTCRQLIFFMSLLNLGVSNYIYILQILSILILTIHCIIQPYKSTWLNIVDGLLILDLVLLSILHGNTANVIFEHILILKSLLVHILVLLPVIYFLGLCIFPLMKTWMSKIKRCHQMKKENYTELTTKKDTVSVTSTVIDIGESGGMDKDEAVLLSPLEREPLLFLQSDTYSSYDGRNNNNRSLVSQRPLKSVIELRNPGQSSSDSFDGDTFI